MSHARDTITEEKPKYTTAELMARLGAYHEGGEWVLQFEVANSTGLNVRRHADAVAMSIWPSRGYKIHGFEIKSSRSDWLRELKNPEKADAVAQFCDSWFLVAPTDIVHEVEVPETWGWLVPAGKSLRIKKHPMTVKATEVGRSFIAAMLRNNHAADNSRVAAQVEKLRALDRENNQKAIDRAIESRTRDYDDLKKAVADFEEQSGLKISGRFRRDPDIGKKLKMLEAIGAGGWSGLPVLISSLRRTTTELERAYQELTGATDPTIQPPEPPHNPKG